MKIFVEHSRHIFISFHKKTIIPLTWQILNELQQFFPVCFFYLHLDCDDFFQYQAHLDEWNWRHCRHDLIIPNFNCIFSASIRMTHWISYYNVWSSDSNVTSSIKLFGCVSIRSISVHCHMLLDYWISVNNQI